MRKVAIVTLSVAVAAGLGVTAAPGGASVAGRNTRFCRAISAFSGSTDITGVTSENAAKFAKALKNAGKVAPRKVRKAMNTLAGIYRRIADGDSPAKVLGESSSSLVSAVTTYGTYFVRQCASASIPTTSPG
jgi:hypothetical protein